VRLGVRGDDAGDVQQLAARLSVEVQDQAIGPAGGQGFQIF